MHLDCTPQTWNLGHNISKLIHPFIYHHVYFVTLRCTSILDWTIENELLCIISVEWNWIILKYVICFLIFLYLISENTILAAELAAKKTRVKQSLIKRARSVAIFSLKLKERRAREAEKQAYNLAEQEKVNTIGSHHPYTTRLFTEVNEFI